MAFCKRQDQDCCSPYDCAHLGMCRYLTERERKFSQCSYGTFIICRSRGYCRRENCKRARDARPWHRIMELMFHLAGL